LVDRTSLQIGLHMTDVLDQWHYFASPVYSIKKPEFLDTVRKASNDVLHIQRKENKIDEIYPVIQADVSGHDQLIEFHDYVINTAWNLLRDQGYNMDNRSTYFTESWVQEHHKYSSMEYHNHNDCNLVAFYFTECPSNPPKLVIHDPRPSKVMIDLPEADFSNISMATSIINFTPTPGMLFFANSWLPHSFTRNASTKPFKFIHMNIATRLNPVPVVYPASAEII